ncbi:hypothetical protein [Pleomorphovibrio marinus]|uniref:hypothetical protein n=1 Tax=Pleomorphovibrio marinus TaxID=2164132 RepID=UPI000E0C21DC|nr:hypothetical protein [Pleomorphovibrio marinus]
MKRRKFFQKTGKLAMLSPLIPVQPEWLNFLALPNQEEMPEWLLELIKVNDSNVSRLLDQFIDEPSHHQFGGIQDSYQMATAHSVTAFLKTGLCALLAKSSDYYKDPELLEKLSASANFLVKVQHEDGTIDLVTTNFHSTPDTAFIVKWLMPIYRVFLHSDLPDKQSLEEPLYRFFNNAGEALVIGGIHTPNHRWVVCGALAELYQWNRNQRYLERAEQWLAEGIDMDPDGQYEEKSSYIYSSLSDRVLISTARGFEKFNLLEYVRKNLEMTFYYLHPNGEIVTEASGRQDNSIVATLERYYYPYRYMALRDRNGHFAAACKLIENSVFEKASGFLYYFLEDTSLWEELPPSKPLPTNYVRKFLHSGLVRIRRGNYDGSILLDNPVFFTFHKRKTVLQGVRLASAFFGKGQFKADSFEEKDGVYVLSSELEGPYYQPFEKGEVSGDGDWSKMPRTDRKTSEVQKLHTNVRIKEITGGFEMEIDIAGTDHVPVALELIFREGGELKGVQPYQDLPETYFLSGEEGIYEREGEKILFGPGRQEHTWVAIRGALPKMNAPTVFLTGFTPFHQKIQLK